MTELELIYSSSLFVQFNICLLKKNGIDCLILHSPYFTARI